MEGRTRLRRETARFHRFSCRPATGVLDTRRGGIRGFVPRCLVWREAQGAGSAIPMAVLAGPGPGPARALRAALHMRTKRALHGPTGGGRGAARAPRRTPRRAAGYAGHCIPPRTGRVAGCGRPHGDCILPHDGTGRAATRRAARGLRGEPAGARSGARFGARFGARHPTSATPAVSQPRGSGCHHASDSVDSVRL